MNDVFSSKNSSNNNNDNSNNNNNNNENSSNLKFLNHFVLIVLCYFIGCCFIQSQACPSLMLPKIIIGRCLTLFLVQCFFAELLSLVVMDGLNQLYIFILSSALSTLTLSSAMQSINSAVSEKILQSQDSNKGQLGGKHLLYPLCYADPPCWFNVLISFVHRQIVKKLISSVSC